VKNRTEQRPETEGEKKQIIGAILSEAETEADQVRSESEQEIASRKEGTKSRVARIKQDAEKRAAEQAKSIIARMDSRIASMQRRNRLELQAKAYRMVTREVRKRLCHMIDAPEYREVLAGWIAEAAIGLHASSASVRASREEQEIAATVMQDAAREAEHITGEAVALTQSSDPPLSSQGVSLTSADGRTAFNNQVETRLIRYESEIRKIIYNSLFREQ